MFNQFYKFLCRNFYIDYKDLEGTVFLAGSGRSGTTWVEDIINSGNDYRVMFEPFYSGKVQALEGWRYRQYLAPDASDGEFFPVAQKILSGDIRDPWIDQFNEKLVCRKRIVKDIRTQLMLAWFRKRFPSMPIILLLRHPCAVASSKIKLQWGTHLDELANQENFIQDYLAPYMDAMEKIETDFERHVFLWCVENHLPLKQFNAGEVLVVFYENLCESPEVEVERIFKFLGQSTPPETLSKINKPSAVSTKESAIKSGTSLVNSWRSAVSDDQHERANELLTLFGLDCLYDVDGRPALNSDEVLSHF